MSKFTETFQDAFRPWEDVEQRMEIARQAREREYQHRARRDRIRTADERDLSPDELRERRDREFARACRQRDDQLREKREHRTAQHRFTKGN